MVAEANAPLKIALVCDFFLPRIGGIELHLADLARELRKRGHQVQVITTTRGEKELEGIKIYRLSGSLLPFWQIAWTGKPFGELQKILNEERFDLIHAHSSVITPLAYAALFLAQQRRIPALLTNHSLLQKTARLFKFLNRAVGFADWPILWSSVGKIASQGILEATGRKNVVILPNGIRAEQWKIPLNPKRKEFRITSVLRLNRKKRVIPLLQAFAQVLEKLSVPFPIVLTLIGDGPYRKKVESEVLRLKLEGKVEVRGACTRDQIRKVFVETDFFVLPTLHEAFGIAALEALCAGLPVIAMRQGGVSDFLKEGEEGFLVERDEELVEKMVCLILDSSLRKTMQWNLQKGDRPFSWENVILKHEEAYQLAIQLMKDSYGEKT